MMMAVTAPAAPALGACQRRTTSSQNSTSTGSAGQKGGPEARPEDHSFEWIEPLKVKHVVKIRWESVGWGVGNRELGRGNWKA